MGKDSESTIVYIYKTITSSLQINPVSFMYIVHKINYSFFYSKAQVRISDYAKSLLYS